MVKELMKRGKARAERSSLMNVGRRVDYAVRALSYLAGQPAGKVVSRSDIEQSQGIPSFYLSKIMKDLVTGGLLVSHVGSKGGFTLAKLLLEISIKDVYECVERPLVLMECLEQARAIVLSVRCACKSPFGNRRRRSWAIFSAASLSATSPIAKGSRGVWPKCQCGKPSRRDSHRCWK